MSVAPASDPAVETDLPRADDRLPDVPRQRGVIRADELDQVRLLVHEIRTTGQVDSGLHQRLVQRNRRVAEAADAGLVAERLAQRLANRECCVLDRVMRVDLEVARG